MDKPQITIEEAQKKALAMDAAIAELVKEFNRQTGCLVRSIELESERTVGGQMVYVIVKSNIDLR